MSNRESQKAAMTIERDCIDALVGVGPPEEEPEPVKLVWYGRPGNAKINHRFVPTMRGGRAVLVKSKTYRSAVESMGLAFGKQHEREAMLTEPVMVSVSVHVYRQHRSGPAEGLAFLDVDACCKAVLDALTLARVYEDDAQVKGMQIVKHLAEAKHMERIEVEVSPCNADPTTEVPS